MTRSISPASRRQSAALERAKRLLQHEQRDLLWYHRFGTCVGQFHLQTERAQGKEVVKKLAVQLQLKVESAPELLWCARKFAREYAKEDVKRLVNRSGKQDGTLTWRHMRALLSVKNRPLRDDLVRQCIKGKWSVNHLRRKIQEKTRFPPRGGGGLIHPETRDEALQHFIKESRAWLNRCQNVWFQGTKREPGTEAAAILAKVEDQENVVRLRKEAINVAKQVRGWANQAKKELGLLASAKDTATPAARKKHRQTKRGSV
jgi:hypothetical protein